MTSYESVVEQARLRLPFERLRRGFHKFRDRLTDRRFWIIQALVLLATAVHWLVELLGIQADINIGLVIAGMYVLYFVPIIYASLNFGREGAVPTAIWAALLALPPIFIWHHGIERLIDIVQHATIIGLAVVISTRVDREVEARRQTEEEIRARRTSESKYRALFEAADEAIVLFDTSGQVHELNQAAVDLFGRVETTDPGQYLADILGNHNAALLLESVHAGTVGPAYDISLVSASEKEVRLEPILSHVQGNGAPSLVQALFRDVTEQRRRERGLEAYTHRIIHAQEEERRRIARDIHDGPLQSMVLLYRQLDALDSGAKRDEPYSEAELAEIRTSVESISDELRRFSRNLRPSILDDLGLVPAVRWLVDDLEQRTAIHTTLVVIGEPVALPEDEELALFRIAQESLRNAERHAEASLITITLCYGRDEVALTIDDNGRGITTRRPLPGPADSESLGILGMQERARLVGGTFEITSGPGEGTRVHVSLSYGYPDVESDTGIDHAD
jgi:PAS domain S-box-containing protein